VSKHSLPTHGIKNRGAKLYTDVKVKLPNNPAEVQLALGLYQNELAKSSADDTAIHDATVAFNSRCAERFSDSHDASEGYVMPLCNMNTSMMTQLVNRPRPPTFPMAPSATISITPALVPISQLQSLPPIIPPPPLTNADEADIYAKSHPLLIAQV